MSRLSPSIVRRAHAYTNSRTPWLMDPGQASRTETPGRTKTSWRLFRYLAGGGLSAFGRTVEQEEIEARRTGFLIKAAVLGAVWLYFWI